ncbi:unnamed protein product [Prunus armeniaca]|uniref:Uncharacterized protein n=1 Tax=Prunus armeniaca TaxID=36596 RepID=A0A6J5VNS4_PRUAR|nr:unnamed protein product [Prunus armeniaca]
MKEVEVLRLELRDSLTETCAQYIKNHRLLVQTERKATSSFVVVLCFDYSLTAIADNATDSALHDQFHIVNRWRFKTFESHPPVFFIR